MSERTILCFGDSNTHGTCPMRGPGDIRRHPRGTRWPSRMAEKLGDGVHVIEEGHPGRTTVHPDPIEGVHKNGFAVLPAILESHRPLDLVIVMLGTNDLKMRFSVPAEDIARSLEKLVLTIRAAECGPGLGEPKLMLVAPPPVEERGWLGTMFAGGAEKSQGLARLYRALAEAHGAAFLDAGQVIAVDPTDGIHFDAEAHRALGDAMAEAVGPLLG